MAFGGIFDKFKEAAGGALGNLTEMATTAAESTGLGDVAQQATDALGGVTDQATEAVGGVTDQATEAVGGVTDQATEALGGVTDKLPGAP